jgi:hypothetical protein
VGDVRKPVQPEPDRKEIIVTNLQAVLRAFFEDSFAASPVSEDDVAAILKKEWLTLSVGLGWDLPSDGAQAAKVAAMLLFIGKGLDRLRLAKLSNDAKIHAEDLAKALGIAGQPEAAGNEPEAAAKETPSEAACPAASAAGAGSAWLF